MDSNKYDVFISCKSEDYKYAEEIYDFLTENHFNTFLASKELRKLGDSQYRESIENALDTTEHIIVFSSNPEYPKSKYVKYEWGLFVDLKLDGQKDGNILTVLKDMTPRELPIGLRRYESFKFENYKDTLLNYVETEEHKERLIQEKARQEEIRLQQEKEKENERIRLLGQIKDEAQALATKLYSIDLDIKKLRNSSKSIGIDKKTCKICNAQFDLDEEFCNVCGWKFHPLEGIKDVEYLININPKQIELHKKLYASSLSGQSSANTAYTESVKDAYKSSESSKSTCEDSNWQWSHTEGQSTKSASKKEVETYTTEQILDKYIIQRQKRKSQYYNGEDLYIKVNWDGLYDFIRNALGYEITRTVMNKRIQGFRDNDFLSHWNVEGDLNRLLSKYQFKQDVAKFYANRQLDCTKIFENDIKWAAVIKYLKDVYGVTFKKWQLFSTMTEKFVSIDEISDRIYEKVSGGSNAIPIFPIKK